MQNEEGNTLPEKFSRKAAKPQRKNK